MSTMEVDDCQQQADPEAREAAVPRARAPAGLGVHQPCDEAAEAGAYPDRATDDRQHIAEGTVGEHSSDDAAYDAVTEREHGPIEGRRRQRT